MKRLKATSVLIMLILSSLVMLVPAPAAADADGPAPLATTDRTVLVELFTGAQCGPCVNVDLGLDDFMENHDRDEVAALVYHRPIPGPDKLSTTETANRHSFYLPPGEGGSTPNYWVDGGIAAVGGFSTPAAAEAWFEGKYDVQSVNASQLSIDVDAQIAPSMYGQIWVNVTALEAPSYSNLYLHVVVARKYYGPWNGGNGVTDHIYTVRKMLSDADGDAFVISSSQTKPFHYTFNLASDGDLSKYDDMAVVAFVQTHSKTEVNSEVYPRPRYIAPILQTEYADVRTIPNVAPVISSGQVEGPERITQDDEVTFKVLYADPDDEPDSGPADVSVHYKNETSAVIQHSLAAVPSANTWKEGRWVQWKTKLDPGTYSYRFSASDGFDDATGDTGWNASTFVVKPRNKIPQLMDEGVVPLYGDTSTVFRFDVLYRDEDNEQAVSAKIYINAEPHEMVTTSTGPWNDWNLYYYETTLSVGENHKFYFEFSDGIDSRRFPVVTDSPNWFAGPEVVAPNNEPTLTTAHFSPSEGTRLDEFSFSVVYTDGENDRPTLSYIYIDGTPFIMDGDSSDYSSGVTFRYSTTLDLGGHQVHYVFSDGSNEVSYPPAGEIEGPVISNLAPIAVIASPADGIRYTPEDYVSFSSVGSADPEDDDLSYAWTSNIDGQFSTLSATDKLLSEGEHTITLTVTDEYGGEASASITLLVKPYEADPYIVDYLKSPESPTETDLVRYTLYLNNRGEKTAQGISVDFLVDNTYGTSETVSVSVDTQMEVRFTWVSVAGEHTITFEIPGDTLSFTEYVNQNTPPASDPVILNPGDSKGRYKPREEIYFTASATDADDDDLSYLWDFGDSYTSTQENPSHTYTAVGDYTVSLTVTDSRGGDSTETFTVQVAKEETEEGGGLGIGLIAGIVVAVLVIIVVLFVFMRGRGGPSEALPPPPEETRPDVPDYLMPDPKPSPVDGPDYPDYSNGIPEEQPNGERSDDGYLGY
jgi:PKD repeat protein